MVPPSPTVEQLIQAAAHYLQEGRMDDARRCFEETLTLEPDHFDALHILGVLDYQEGHLEPAHERIARALEINPGFAEAHYNLGRVLQSLGRDGEAIAAYRSALDRAPQLDAACFNIGLILSRRGEHREAADWFRRGVELNPQDPQILVHLGDALAHINENRAAEEALQTAIQLDPANLPAWNRLGTLYRKTEHYEAALEAYQRAIALQPEASAAYFNLGNLYEELGDMENAKSAFEHAVKTDPTFTPAWNNLGNVLHRLKEMDAARGAFRRTLELNPGHASASHMLAVLEGGTPERAPQDYVRRVFDKAASEFEERLVDTLQYKSPKELRAMLSARLPKATRFESAVDLGCGTGLAGREFREWTTRLTGVDLSDKMVAKAGKTGHYDALFSQDIIEFLDNSEDTFDLFLAMDVLVYLGNLQPLFQSIATHARPGARFLFSLEDLDSGAFKLQTTGRYAHSREYIHQLAETHGFTVEAEEQTVIRQENDQPIPGMNYILRFRGEPTLL